MILPLLLGVLVSQPQNGEALAPPAVVEPVAEFRLLPAIAETGSILALEIGRYEWQIELNKKDFDFDRTLADQKRRYDRLYGFRFDDNGFGINMGHAYYNGSFYYDVARVLGGSFAEAWLFRNNIVTESCRPAWLGRVL